MSKQEVIDLFNKIRDRYLSRFNKLKIFEKYKSQIEHFCFLKALNELPLPLQEIAMSISQDTIDIIEREQVNKRRRREIHKKLKRLTNITQDTIELQDTPY